MKTRSEFPAPAAADIRFAQPSIRVALSTLIFAAMISPVFAAAPVISEVRIPADGFLQEGRSVPLLILGENLGPDLVPTFEFTGLPATFTFSQYLGNGTNAGVVMNIPQLPFVGEGQLLIGQLRLTAPDNSSATITLNIAGLDELVVSGGQYQTVNNPPGRIFSRIFVGAGGTLRVTGSSLDWKSTGPVDIEGVIDAHGNDGADANGRFGGGAGRNGGPGGAGGYEAGGSGEVPATAGGDGVEAVFGQRHVPPRGKGGAAGFNDGAETDSGCTVWNSGPCNDIVASLLEYYRFMETPGDRSFDREMLAGAQGWPGGAGGTANRPKAGRGGGGGGGRGLTNGESGGGGGSGGDGGLGVRIVSSGHVRVSGNINTSGGDGGNGVMTGAGLPLTGSPTLGQLARSGGGGGGGAGGELILLGAAAAPTGARDVLNTRGAPGGSGGMLLNRNLNQAGEPIFRFPVVDRSFDRVLRGRDGSRLIGAGPFATSVFDQRVTKSSVFSIADPEPLGAVPASFEIRGEIPGQIRTVTVGGRAAPGSTIIGPPFRANLVLFPGFNTIRIRPTDGEEPLGDPAYEVMFPRILCLSGADTDGDGISDEDELRLGLDPGNADSDGDGVPDGDDFASNPTPSPSEGKVYYVAGDGVQGHGAAFEDNVPALDTNLGSASSGIDAFAMGQDGNMYVSTPANNGTSGNYIRRVGTDGIINTIAGGGVNDQEGVDALDWLYDGDRNLHGPSAGPDGSV